MNNTGQVFLAGGGNENQSYELDARFAKKIDGKKVMYIPVALNRDSLGFEACFDWVTETFLKFPYVIDVPEFYMYLDAKRIKEDLHMYDAVYIGGGNTFKLLQFIVANGLFKPLQEFYQSDRYVYGGSAGAIIFGKDIRIVNEENDANYSYFEGFDILKGVSIICHYEISLDEGIQRFVADNRIVIALPEDSGLIVEDGCIIEIVGAPLLFDGGNKKQLYEKY